MPNAHPSQPVKRPAARRTRTSPASPAADVRERILAAAETLLATDGIAALTQPRVSRAAGVTQSHLTYYFPRRADLILAIARHALTVTLGRMRATGAAPPAARMRRAVAAMQARMLDERTVRLMLGLIVASESDRDIKRALAEFIASVRAMLGDALGGMGLRADPQTAACVHAFAVGVAVLNLARDDARSRAETGTLLAAGLARLAGPARAARPSARPRRGSE